MLHEIMSVTNLGKLRALAEENNQLKRLVAELSLDKQVLLNLLSKNFQSLEAAYKVEIKRANRNVRGFCGRAGR